MKDPAGSNLD